MFKKKEKPIKEKKIRTMKVGTHKKSVIALWVVLIASVSFGVYKNFTAIDQHTTHEVETIQLRLNDTNGIENFVKNFCKSYYTWSNSKEAIEARTQAISAYLTQELQDLNVDTVRTDIPTSSTVTDVLIWDVAQSGENAFSVTYEIDQQIKEGDQTRNVSETYTVTVHVDADGDMVIIQNPTLAPANIVNIIFTKNVNLKITRNVNLLLPVLLTYVYLFRPFLVFQHIHKILGSI